MCVCVCVCVTVGGGVLKINMVNCDEGELECVHTCRM